MRIVLALVAIALGIYLITRPISSLGVLVWFIGAGFILQGVLVLTDDDHHTSRWWRFAEALAWLAAGVAIVAFGGLTLRVLVVVIAIALCVRGVRQIVPALRAGAPVDTRIAAGAFGIASIGFGLLALLWADITLVVTAVVFGAWLIMSGVGEVRRLIRPGDREPSQSPSRVRRFARTITALVAVAVAVVACVVSVNVRSDTPDVDDFYSAPSDIPAKPGVLIRSESFTREVPDDARAWRILYSTTRGDGSPAVASALVVVPKRGDGGWPVIDWNHGTTGYAQPCAPSLLTQPFESGAMFVLPEVIKRGWALVATDYIGLGTKGPHPYLIGVDSAHASLDAVRAARALEPADLGDDTVVWGHSQGGGSALWSGALAPTYAPDVPLAGVAALAPASNLPGLIDNLPNVTGGSVFSSFAVAAYIANYPDVTWRGAIRPGAEPIVRQMSGRCLSGAGVLVSVLSALSMTRDPNIFATDPTSGALGKRLKENVPPTTIGVPLLIGQGEADGLITPAAQREYVDTIRRAGRQVDYRTFPGLGHVDLVEAESALIPQLLEWTTARFR
ncbi:lipase family protein [Gordonia sp. (in: high G+C Gram-positive bacteria)]|uniref:lipase family protein n=1 Tax=Gordonia sp. (in: high G+C Gram-positive bacteria) TaxID=84139 RepID=UPI0025C03C35|nr:lipase family protein [Gordonia sp. (in: high G+C Gram-positive bacteria)]